MKALLLIMLLLPAMLFPQGGRDPRALGLAGAYTTVSRSYQAAGWNPANLYWNDDARIKISLGAFNLQMKNSAFSLSDINRFNDADLEAINPYTNRPYKDEFLALFGETGWSIYSGISFLAPLVSISRDNQAYTADLQFLSSVTMPRAFMDILFNGNQVNVNYDLTLQMEMMGLIKHSFSMALPVESGAFGISVNYLQGIYYFGMDPDSSKTFFRTDTATVSAAGEYLFRQTFGGNGVGLDIGYSSKPVDGWQFSIALNNLFSNIEWNKPTYTYHNIIRGFGFDVKRADYKKYWYRIDELGPETLIPIGSDTTKRTIDDIFVSGDQTIQPEDYPFKVKYPTLFRAGLSKALNDEVTFIADISTGFEDRFFARSTWLFASAIEIVRSPSFPVRVGVAYGGPDYRQMSFGFGLHLGFFALDYGMAFHDGFKMNTAKGLEMALGLHLKLSRIKKEI
jgi:hypothetical protein